MFINNNVSKQTRAEQHGNQRYDKKARELSKDTALSEIQNKSNRCGCEYFDLQVLSRVSQLHSTVLRVFRF